MGTTVKAPAARNYGQETRDTLKAQIDMAPALLEAERKTRPGYTALDLESLDQMLNGVDGQGGLFDVYDELVPRISAVDEAAATRQRTADIRDVSNLGPEMQAAIRAANPEQWALMDELDRQAQSDLAAGSTLTPDMRAEIEQYVKAGQSARGMGAGPSDVYEEAFTLGSAGQALQDKRRAFAMGMVDLNQRVSADPLLAILSRPSQAGSQAQGFTGQGQSMAAQIGPRLLNPESQYAADIYAQDYEGELAARTATASNKSALFGGGIGFAGRLLGGYLSRGR